jgi:hypothetical protein
MEMRYSFLAVTVLLVSLGVSITTDVKAETRCRWENKVMLCKDMNSIPQSDRYDNRQGTPYDSRYDSYDNSYNNSDTPNQNRYGNTYDNTYGNAPYDNRYDSRDQAYGDRNGIYSQINQVYRDVLGRSADNNGLRTYTNDINNNGKSLAWVRERLAESPEARDAVNRVYRKVLGRDADSSGLDSYTKSLRNGWTLQQVRAELANSAEARNARRR